MGYCGADLKALCTEAALHALRRRYPQIYESDDKLVIDPSQVAPTRVDFRAAMEAITPASPRAAAGAPRARLGALRRPLMGETLARALDGVRRAFPPAAMAHEAAEAAAAAAARVGGGGGTLGARAVRVRPGRRRRVGRRRVSWTSSGARTDSVSRRPPTRRRSSS